MAETEGVRDFHLNDDVDTSKFAHHHTIGEKYGQAAPGEGYAKLVKRVTELEGRSNWYNSYLYAGRASAASNATNGAWTTVSGYDTPFNGFGSINIHNAEEGNPVAYSLGQIVASSSVWIDVMFYVEMANSATGRRGIRITRNGVDSANEMDANFQAAVSATPMRLGTTYHGPLFSGQNLTLQVFQDSGAALSMSWKQLSFRAKAL